MNDESYLASVAKGQILEPVPSPLSVTQTGWCCFGFGAFVRDAVPRRAPGNPITARSGRTVSLTPALACLPTARSSGSLGVSASGSLPGDHFLSSSSRVPVPLQRTRPLCQPAPDAQRQPTLRLAAWSKVHIGPYLLKILQSFCSIKK